MTPYYEQRNITIYLGDSLEILKEIPSKSIDLIFTDPPYGHNNNNGDLILMRECALGKRKATTKQLQDDKTARPISNDSPEMAANCFFALMQEAPRLLKPGCCCCCCCCGGGGPDPQFARWCLEMNEHIPFKQMIIWDKGKMGMGWHYRRSYETVLVGQMSGKAKWHDTSHKVENIIRPGDYGIKKIIPRKDQHPTQKPVALSSHFIRLHTTEGDTVLDPFMGSGSTAVSCQQLNRRFIGIELEERWAEMAVNRLCTDYENNVKLD